MSAPKYIVYVNLNTGQINSVQSRPGDWEEMPAGGGTQINDTEKIYWLTQSNLETLNFANPLQFLRTYHWDYTSDTWFYRGEDPGEFYEWNFSTAAWAVNNTRLTAKVREARNGKLQICDWTQGPDSPLSDEKKAEWRTYRQSLRDIMTNLPANLDDPDNVTWPTEPT